MFAEEVLRPVASQKISTCCKYEACICSKASEGDKYLHLVYLDLWPKKVDPFFLSNVLSLADLHEARTGNNEQVYRYISFQSVWFSHCIHPAPSVFFSIRIPLKIEIPSTKMWGFQASSWPPWARARPSFLTTLVSAPVPGSRGNSAWGSRKNRLQKTALENQDGRSWHHISA